ncbi:hypothetical protein CEXT_117841 [Caerostris extrusa]|uniref:Uncharacterized protein n=1 Tax=Caerostris extrusa TaxID=172846 RepID=A0AAV4P9H7_CAEEX|nr:hypothetical protein CEXT_117841 [Caerostris extrusa]
MVGVNKLIVPIFPPTDASAGNSTPPEASGVVHQELLLPHICPQFTATNTPLSVNKLIVPIFPTDASDGNSTPPEASGVVHRELLLPQHLSAVLCYKHSISNYTNRRT